MQSTEMRTGDCNKPAAPAVADEEGEVTELMGDDVG